MRSAYDVVIIGEGIAGLGCALAFQKAAPTRKILILEGRLAGAATERAAGILDPLFGLRPGDPLFKLCRTAFNDFPKWLDRHRISGRHLHHPGALYLALSSAEERELKKLYAARKKVGLPMIFFDHQELTKKYSFLSQKVRAALSLPTLAHVYPRDLKTAIKNVLRLKGIHFLRVNPGKLELLIADRKIKGLKIGNQKLAAGIVIQTTGAWSGKFSLGYRRWPVVPKRGQIMILKGCLPRFPMLHTMDGRYVIPWERDRCLLGSTVEKAGFRPETSSHALAKLRQHGLRLVPSLKSAAVVSAWAGLRPCSADEKPIIGGTDVQGLYLATGYYRLGILLGGYLGEILVKGILSGRMPKSLRIFSPKRFSA